MLVELVFHVFTHSWYSGDGFILALNATDASAAAAFGKGGLQVLTSNYNGTCIIRKLTLSGTTLFGVGQIHGPDVGIGADGAGLQLSKGWFGDIGVFALDASSGAGISGFGTGGGVQKVTGTNDNSGYDICASASAVYVVGYFTSPDFGIGGLGTIKSTGSTSAFIAALSRDSGSPLSTFGNGGIQTFQSSGMAGAYGVSVSGSTVYATGTFTGTDGGLGGLGNFDATGFGGFLLPLEATTGTMSAPRITSALDDQATIGAAYSYTITATGTGPISYSTSVLPDGLKLSGNVISGTPSRAGVYSISLTAQNVFGADNQTLELTILYGDGDSGPTITSIPVASPNPVLAGQEVTLIVAATDAQGDNLSYAWDFGDGSTGTGASVTHIYVAAGVYSAVVTVSDGSLSDSAGVGVAVNSGEVDEAIYTVRSTSVKLNFKSANKDSLTVSGTLPVEIGFSPDQQPLDIYFGDLKTSFTLDEKAKSLSRDSFFKILGKLKNGAFTSAATKFAFSLKGQTLLPILSPLGFANKTITKPGLGINIPVIVTLNDMSVMTTVKVNYTARLNASGTAK